MKHDLTTDEAETDSLPAPPSPSTSQTETAVTTAIEGQPWFLTISDQKVVVLLCLLCLGWIGYRWLDLSRWGRQETELLRQPHYEYAYQLDLNQANWIELSLLDGIGEVLGKKIVTDREQHGPFQRVDDLTRVNGVGEKTLAKLKPFLYIADAEEL